MQKNYYPWKVMALLTWIDGEETKYRSPLEFSRTLGISIKTIQAWQISSVPDITLEDIQKIAAYRNWSISETFEWLDLKEAHRQTLLGHM